MSDNSKPQDGFLARLGKRLQLVPRLMLDGRVSPLLKLAPLAAVVYFVLPDPIFGPLDDLLVAALALILFVELCPPDVTAEHAKRVEEELRGVQHDPQTGAAVIDGEFREADEPVEVKHDEPK